LRGTPIGSSPAQPSKAALKKESSIINFIRSDTFQRYSQAVDRFLGILAWLQVTHPKEFGNVVLGFRRGSRRYFGKTQSEVEQSGAGITAKVIPRSPFW